MVKVFRHGVAALMLAGASLAHAIEASPSPATIPTNQPIAISAHAYRPAQTPFSDEMVTKLKVLDGFKVNVYAKNLLNARMLAISDDGTVYLTRRQQNDVIMLPDKDSDGVADSMKAVITDEVLAHGISIKGKELYLANDDKVLIYELKDDGTVAGKPRVFTDQLPDGGQHPNKTILWGPDGNLYLSVGSDCNACDEPNPESATMLQLSPDGKKRHIFARGLRNTIGFAFHPKTKALWGWDHGIDWLGDDTPPEELNELKDGKDYGWPYVWGERQINATMDAKKEGLSLPEYAKMTEPMVLGYHAHSAPLAFVFYTGQQFPEELRADAFVTMRGSWNRAEPHGYRVLRVRFENDRPVETEDFVSGFLAEDGKSQFGRPCGMVVAKDGSLLFTDDTQGVIYRVSYGK